MATTHTESATCSDVSRPLLQTERNISLRDISPLTVPSSFQHYDGTNSHGESTVIRKSPLTIQSKFHKDDGTNSSPLLIQSNSSQTLSSLLGTCTSFYDNPENSIAVEVCSTNGSLTTYSTFRKDDAPIPDTLALLYDIHHTHKWSASHRERIHILFYAFVFVFLTFFILLSTQLFSSSFSPIMSSSSSSQEEIVMEEVFRESPH